MATKRKTRQHSQLSQHGEFLACKRQLTTAITAVWSESSCAFPKNGTATGSRGESARAMVATARQKRLYLHRQGEFQHNYFDFVSLHHSDHDGVVRIFVGHSEIVKRLLHYLHYITRHNFLYTRSVMTLYIVEHAIFLAWLYFQVYSIH